MRFKIGRIFEKSFNEDFVARVTLNPGSVFNREAVECAVKGGGVHNEDTEFHRVGRSVGKQRWDRFSRLKYGEGF